VHLRSLTLKGFKSFPDRTRLEFSPGVSVVVGPNGSGKSNITDAVLWALGEQSPLAVRGQSMQDVIFAGGHGVQARAEAEVEVVLDNADGAVELEVGEVAIARRLNRAGEGDYRVNGARCRLVDVLELLSDTGLGKEMHSVVSQGRVEAIVTSKPRDRRLLIEEAAGLGKHRKRRRRAQLKLDRTQDIEREARTRLRPLKRQAEAAELHERLERQSSEARWTLARDAVREATAALAAAEAEVRSAREAAGETERSLHEVAARREAAEEALASRASEREALSGRFYAARSAGERIGLRLEGARGAVVELDTRVAHRERALAALAEESAGDAGDDDGTAERIAALESELGQLACDRAERLAEELEALDVRRAEAEAEHARRSASADAAGERRREAEAAAEAARAARREHEVAAERARRECARIGAELAAVNQFLRAQAGAPGGAQALADALRADPGYELALAAALGARLRAAVAADLAEGAALLDRAGRDGGAALVAPLHRGPSAGAPSAAASSEGAPFAGAPSVGAPSVGAPSGAASSERAPLAGAPSVGAPSGAAFSEGAPFAGVPSAAGSSERAPSGAAEPLRAHVHATGNGPVAALADALLASVWVVDDIAALPRDFAGVAVTRQGRLWSAATRELRQVPAGGEDRVLAERNRRDALLGEVERAAAAERAAQAALEQAGEAVAAADAARDEADRAARTAARAREDAAEAARHAARLIEQRRQAPDDGPAAGRHSQLEAALAAERRLAERAARERAERARRIADERARLAHDQDLRPRAERLVAALEAAAAAVASHAQRLEAELAADREAGERLAGELRECAARETEVQAALKARGEAVTRGEVFAQQVRDRAQEAQRELTALAGRLGLEATPAPEALPEAERAALGDRIARLQRRREQLGPVNPLAQDEYAEALAHVKDLERQRGDLEAALRELESLIRDTDRRIRESFEETFTAAAQNFEEVVEQLFPGGRGRLRLVREDHGPRPVLGGADPEEMAPDAEADADEVDEGPEDDMGVEIEITPAGKATKRLTLLSGGEKSLTALAFLFAVFLARPCPFYILDEVEAALDDLNIDRFLALLRRFADRAQFIVVTHQKRTMEAADCLYGVSMAGDGVSKVVSRRLPGEPAARERAA
jgi:chromosome segregation protein